MNLTTNSRYSRTALALGVGLAAAALSSVAQAGPILADDGIVYIERAPSVLNTTAVADPGGNPVGSISVNGGTILMEDYDGNALTTYTPNPSWWNAPGVAYTTTTSGILLDFENLNVTGFTFNIGANKNANAWIKAYYDDGAGHELSTSWFGGISPSSTPNFGVYVSQPETSCAVITRIEVDPTFEWGIGNFGLAESSCAAVPSPSEFSLLTLGMFSLGLAHVVSRRRMIGVSSAA